MKLHRLVVAAFALGALMAGSAVQAKPVTWTIDRNHSGVTFSVRHLFSKVPGSFDTFSGTIVYDAENVAASSAQVEIDAKSINTKVEKRDNHLRSADFFDVDKFPTLTFKSTGVKDLGGGKHELAGDLTMHGVTKPVTLAVTFLGSGDAMGGARAGFEATGRVNRKDFGILWNKTLDKGGTLLSDDVDITIQIEAVEEKPEAATAEKK